MPARRPLKSRKTSSTVRGLYEAAPSITQTDSFLPFSFFSFKVLESEDREAEGERKGKEERGKGGKRKICKKMF